MLFNEYYEIVFSNLHRFLYKLRYISKINDIEIKQLHMEYMHSLYSNLNE